MGWMRQAPTVMGRGPLRPAGKRAACQPKSRSSVRGRWKRWVESRVTSTMPSMRSSPEGTPRSPMPRCQAMESRTRAGSRISPSMALVFTTSEVRASRVTCFRRSSSRGCMRSRKFPCRWLTLSSWAARAQSSQVRAGQSVRWCRYCCRMSAVATWTWSFVRRRVYRDDTVPRKPAATSVGLESSRSSLLHLRQVVGKPPVLGPGGLGVRLDVVGVSKGEVDHCPPFRALLFLLGLLRMSRICGPFLISRSPRLLGSLLFRLASVAILR